MFMRAIDVLKSCTVLFIRKINSNVWAWICTMWLKLVFVRHRTGITDFSRISTRIRWKLKIGDANKNAFDNSTDTVALHCIRLFSDIFYAKFCDFLLLPPLAVCLDCVSSLCWPTFILILSIEANGHNNQQNDSTSDQFNHPIRASAEQNVYCSSVVYYKYLQYVE